MIKSVEERIGRCAKSDGTAAVATAERETLGRTSAEIHNTSLGRQTYSFVTISCTFCETETGSMFGKPISELLIAQVSVVGPGGGVKYCISITVSQLARRRGYAAEPR